MNTIRTANAVGWLARTLLLNGQPEAAEPLAREALGIYKRDQPDSSGRFYWMCLLGEVLLAENKPAEAEPLVVQGYEGLKQREAALPAGGLRRLAAAGSRVVRYYEATKQPEKAREWREKVSSSNRPGR